MYISRIIPLRGNDKRKGSTKFAVSRDRLRNPKIDAEPTRSPFDAVARGLVSIGDRLRAPQSLRVL
jgi:hypothetical protein